jgi:hypothetical protein
MRDRLGSTEYQREIIGRHVGDLDQRKAGVACEFFHRLDIAYAPFGIALPQARIKSRIAFRQVLAATCEGTVKEKHPTFAQGTPCAGNQTLGDAPWRDVNDIGAEHREQLAGATFRPHRITPGRIGQIDPLWRTDIRELRMPPPRLNADEVIFVEVARPPGDVGKLTGEFDNVLTGAAAGLNGVAGFAGQVPLQNAADRLMVTVKGRGVEAPVGFEAATIFAKFNDILSHDCLPERRHPRCQAIAFML